MGFVQNEEVVRKNEAALAFFLYLGTYQHNKQERVVNHQNVRAQQTFPRLLIKTARILAACFLCANVRFATDLYPNFGIRLDRQIAERTVPRGARPFRQPVQLILLRSGEKLIGLLQRTFQSSRTKVILTPLHQRSLKLDRQNLLQNRDVFVKKLLLEINGVRRDD